MNLSNSTVFWWGALGAFISFLVVFVLPEALLAWNGKQVLKLSVGRVIAAIVIAGVFVAAGGVLAIAFGDVTKSKHALAYGLGIEGILGGTLKAFTKTK